MATTILLIMAVALLAMVSASLKRSSLYSRQVSAVNIAEAGINYYLWHLEHNPNDFWDNCSANSADACRQLNPDGSYGPYSHDYTDNSGKLIGNYSLLIYPTNDTNIVKLKSTGTVNGSTTRKTITTDLTIPSFANAFINSLTDEIYVDTQEVINGPVWVNSSNKGIRNYGEIKGKTNLTCSIDSTFTTKWVSDSYCPGGICPCAGGPGKFDTTPIVYSAAPFNLADIDFNDLKSKAIAQNQYYGDSNKQGYHITLADSQYSITKVSSYKSNTAAYGQINIEKSYLPSQAYAGNLMFFDDNVWVDGTVKNREMTLVSSKNIFINGNITYAQNDSVAKLGLVANQDIPIVSTCPNDLTIDAAMLAKNGRAYFQSSGPLKGTLNIYGAITQQGGLEFQWTSSGIVYWGFAHAGYNYDNRLLYTPPPYFPKSKSYQIVNWHEE